LGILILYKLKDFFNQYKKRFKYWIKGVSKWRKNKGEGKKNIVYLILKGIRNYFFIKLKKILVI
jgi:hypothetical protein